MASSFTHAPGHQTGGCSVDIWLDHNWNAVDWALEVDALAAVGADADHGWIHYDGGKYAVYDSGIAFRNFRPLKDGADGGYMAEPVAIGRYPDIMRIAFKRSSHKGVNRIYNVKGGDVIIPLGQPRWSKGTTKTVLRQSARVWVSGGENTADMSDENVLVMYYGALQSLAYAASVAEDKAKQAWLFGALAHLTRSFALVAREEPTFQKITTAMVMTPGVDDMLQKALAHVFHPAAVWDKATRLEMLSIILRRNLRHGAKMVGMAPGPFAVFILAPLLRGIAMNPTAPVNAADLQAKFNAGMTRLLDAFVAHATSDPEAMEVAALVALTGVIGAPLNDAQASGLLTFCRSTADMSAQPDWVAMGALPAPPALTPVVTTARYAVGGRPGDSYAAVVRPYSATAFRLLGFKGVTWSGVQFATPGVYSIVAHDLGVAKQGEGNTRGQELVANWRITCGTDILPRERDGYSSAGIERALLTDYTARKRFWRYVDRNVSNPYGKVPFGTRFTVMVTETSVILRAHDRELWRTTRNGEPVLLGFKNIWLDVTYAPLPEPPKPVVAPPVDLTPATARGPLNYSAAARGELRRADLDLPPAALIAALRSAALNA